MAITAIVAFASVWQPDTDEPLQVTTFDLPNPWFATAEGARHWVRLGVDSLGRFFIDGAIVTPEVAQSVLATHAAENSETVVLLEPEDDAPFGNVLIALGIVRSAGLRRDSLCFMGIEAHRDFEKAVDHASKRNATTNGAERVMVAAQSRTDTLPVSPRCPEWELLH
ncbi:ExbD/TolR family protein [Aurantiacibacter gangjinensis]|uniref:ExbD/TolR family protein n=1 Tax=Aurantiacibacter gangjinensis TaxID=502682 RepID=UPI0012DFEF01|nr:hypothetical protein [Aurantiacibacter gangjinensis]